MYNPEYMPIHSNYEFHSQFHYIYARLMLSERSIRYSKTRPRQVCSQTFLDQLIARLEISADIESFGEFIKFMGSVTEQINKRSNN